MLTYALRRNELLLIGYRSNGSLIVPIRENVIFPISSCVYTTLWMHHTDTNKIHGGKVIWELHKNATSCHEEILEATVHEKHLYGHLTPISKTIQVRHKTCRTLLEKQEQIHKWLYSLDSNAWTRQRWLTNKNLFTRALCVNWMQFGSPTGSDGS